MQDFPSSLRIALRVSRAVLLAWGLLAVSVQRGAAQLGAGTLTGRVIDSATRRPVADVVVTASAPELQSEQVVVTDNTGSFRIPNLPPGRYELRFEGDSFHPLTRPDIELRSGSTLQVPAELLPDVLVADVVEVVAHPPTVDVGTARSGITLNQDFTSRVPVASPAGKGGTARSFEQLAELAPTGTSDAYGSGVAGTTSPENVYIVDGMSTSDPGFGYNATPLSIDFIKETNIITGGYLPEYGRGGGGVLEVVTKSGSNEFHGSVFGNVTPWQARQRFLPPQETISTTPRLTSVRDIGFDLGGPIVRDKLWFYLGADYGIQTFDLQRNLNALLVDAGTGEYLRDDNGLIRSERIPGTQRTDVAQQNAFQYLGKLTYSPTPDDRIELSHRGTPTRSGGDGKWYIDFEYGLPYTPGSPSTRQQGTYAALSGETLFDSYGTSLKWTHAELDKRLTFDTTLAWQHQHSAYLAADGSELGGGGLSGIPQFLFQRTNPIHTITDFETIGDPSICVNPVADGDARCPVSRYVSGGAGVGLEQRYFNTYQARELATFVTPGLGHHVIKAGLELVYSTYKSNRADSGGFRYSENSSGTAVTNSPYGGLSAPDEAYLTPVQRFDVASLSVGAFAQDSWSIMDKVTLNAGLRYDSQIMYADRGVVGLSLPNQWSPRVGLIYDPTQRGRAKLFANYAVYYQTFPIKMMTRGGSGESGVQARRGAANCNPASSNYPASCEDTDNLVHNVNNDVYNPNDKWWSTQSGRLVIDPDIKPQSSNEFSAGGELEVIPNGRLGLSYIHRDMNSIVEDMSRNEGNSYFLGNPGEGIATGIPRASRTYDAGILHFTKLFSQGWLAQASYTLSHLRGNWEGLFRSQTTQLDPGSNSDFDLSSLLVNRTGDLGGDRRHEIKLFAAKDIALGRYHRITVGAGYQARSGGPTNYLARHWLYGRGEVFLLPRGSGERLPWTHNIDIHVAYALVEGKQSTLSLTFDVFNVFNFQQITNVSQQYTFRGVQPILGAKAADPFVNGNPKNIKPELVVASDTDSNPTPFSESDRNRAFGSPQAYQTPTTFRIGIKSTF